MLLMRYDGWIHFPDSEIANSYVPGDRIFMPSDPLGQYKVVKLEGALVYVRKLRWYDRVWYFLKKAYPWL